MISDGAKGHERKHEVSSILCYLERHLGTLMTPTFANAGPLAFAAPAKASAFETPKLLLLCKLLLLLCVGWTSTQQY